MIIKKEKYEYNSIKIDTLIDEYQTGVLQIPRIQRKLVWNKEQKQKLQDSITKGFPVGVILFSNINSQKYIIDGLQRTTTIMGIFKNMFENMHVETLKKNISETINKLNLEDSTHKNKINNSDFEELEKFIFNNIRYKIELKNPRDSDLFAKTFFNKHLKAIQEYNKEFDRYFVEAILRNIHKKASDELNINEYSLPYIIFDGTVKETADLFELINKQGTKLDNSDIWRSNWSIIKMGFEDSKIMDKINASFDNIFDDSHGIKHERVNSLSPFDVIWYIFEELFSKNWSHPISKTFSGKVNKTKDSDKVITNLASLVILIKFHILLESNEDNHDFADDEIGEKIQQLIRNKEDVEEIIKRLHKCVNLFDDIFHTLSVYKGNKQSNNPGDFLPKKTYIVAILGNIYKLIYDKKNLESLTNEHKYNFNKRYIFDLLSENFKTSSSKKAFISMRESQYLKPLTHGMLERLIENLFDENWKDSKTMFDHKTSTFMAYLFMKDIKITENDEYSFHNDHVIPKSKLKIAGIKNGVNSFANLSLIVDSTNTKKSASIDEKHIYDDKIYKWAENNYKDLAKNLKISYDNIEKELTQDNYRSFLIARKKIIIKMYLEK